MYKAIIADDEIRICMMLRKLIAWDSLGIEIIDECHDGPSTLKAIFEKRPDIVISDIKMPGIDGLEIVRRCNDANIDCAFLLISGHAEFEYARMAIQYNVENYLLKPINKIELENSLQQIKGQLERSQQASSQQSDMSNQIQMDNQVLQSQFLGNVLLIPDWIHKTSLAQVREDFHLDFDVDQAFYVVVLECINKNSFTADQHRLLLKQIQNDYTTGGKITLRLLETGSDLKIYVRDNGVGMTDEQVRDINARLLEDRDVQPTPHSGTTGIALYNINRRIKLAYGTEYGIRVFSTEQVGANVMVHVPKRLSEVEK